MTTRPIIPITDARLRRPSLAVDRVDDEVRRLASDMLDVMHAAGGAGLAAVQIGVMRRLFVMDLGDGGKPVTLINPAIVTRSREAIELDEGCLSMPGLYFPVARARRVKVSFLDIDGQRRSLQAEDFAAVCVQHEIDHLDGIRSIDRVSPLRRSMLLARYRKLTR